MTPLRIGVEWGFGEVLKTFAFLDHKKNIKLFLQPVGLLYKVAVILTYYRTIKLLNIFSWHHPCYRNTYHNDLTIFVLVYIFSNRLTFLYFYIISIIYHEYVYRSVITCNN